MGHLYAKGSISSESEREIHVGNAAAIESNIFSTVFDYVALGHIHRPQIINKNEYIRYSGSPIALSFSEKSDNKSFVVLDIINGKIQKPNVISIPKFRALKKISGDLEYIKDELSKYKPEYALTSFVEIEVREAIFSAKILTEVDNLVSHYALTKEFTILKPRIIFEEGAKDTSILFEEGIHIEDLKPLDVFSKLMDHQCIESDEQELLKEAFIELLDSPNPNEA